MNDDDTDSGDTLTDEDRAAIGHAWRELIEDKAHQGKMHYSPIPVRGILPGSFRIPRDVFEALGDGDLKLGGYIVHAMFGIEDDPERPDLVGPSALRIVGDGSLAAGRRVLDRWVAQVRKQSREGVTLEHDGGDNAEGHGWSVRR
jgi:hypothetical protein